MSIIRTYRSTKTGLTEFHTDGWTLKYSDGLEAKVVQLSATQAMKELQSAYEAERYYHMLRFGGDWDRRTK